MVDRVDPQGRGLLALERRVEVEHRGNQQRHEKGSGFHSCSHELPSLFLEYQTHLDLASVGSPAADLQNQGWNLTVSLVLTMERASYEGVVPQTTDWRTLGVPAEETV